MHFIQWLLSSCSTSKWPYFQSPKHELLKVNLRYLCPETVRSQKRSKVVSQNWNQEARRTFQLSETWKHEARRTSGQKIFGLIHQKFSRTRYVFDFLKRTWNLQIYQRNELLSMFSKISSWFFSLVLVRFDPICLKMFIRSSMMSEKLVSSALMTPIFANQIENYSNTHPGILVSANSDA